MATDFVHLHNHSVYSTKDSTQRLDDMCETAARDGQPAIAMTDHGSLGGSWKFNSAASNAGIKPVIGIEAYLAIGEQGEHQSIAKPTDDADVDDTVSSAKGAADGSSERTAKYQHLTVLAENPAGWANLLHIENQAHDNFWYKPQATWEGLASHSDGLIVLTGCLGGPVMGRLFAGDPQAARANLGRLVDIFGRDQVFVEVMSHGIEGEARLLPELVDLARSFGLRMVATNDSHFTHAEDHGVHDAWLCAGSGSQITDPKRFRLHGQGYHLRTAAEMHALFDDQNGTGDAVTTSRDIAERCTQERVLPESGLRLPVFDPDNELSADQLLYQAVKAGAKERYGEHLPREVTSRLRHELDIIAGARMSDYFLIVADMIDWAKRSGQRVGPGRGSAAGSCVAYCLGIVRVDPIKHHLLFERFLSPTRVGMPDIDSDFEQRHRDDVVGYLIERWGADRVAKIGTYGMSLSRSSLRTAGRVLGRQDLGVTLSEMVPDVTSSRKATFAELADLAFTPGEAFRSAVDESPDMQEVVAIASGLEGVIANESVHACGVVIADSPLSGVVPLRRDRGGADPRRLVTEWDGGDVEEMGLLKMDVLGLKNLDGISETVRLIQSSTGELVEPESATDNASAPGLAGERAAAAWRLLTRGQTAGLFQVSSAGMTDLCQRIQPQDIDDLSAVIALYRPGPMGIGMHDRYAQRKTGLQQVDYDAFTSDPAEVDIIEEVLGETFGVPVYQEQIMRLGEVVGGFGPVERDRLRHAVGKKKVDEMAEVEELFLRQATESVNLAGEPKHPFRRETAVHLWAAFRSAGQYAFNKAHSVGYAKLAYEVAWLKANWPAAFAAGWLATTDDPTKRLDVLSALRAEGVSVVGPDVNASDVRTSLVPGLGSDGSPAIAMGLSEIKGVKSHAATIVEERRSNGPFSSLADLVERLSSLDDDSRKVPSNVTESLVESGACDRFGPRMGMAMALPAIRAGAEVGIPQCEWGIVERSARERALLGIAISANPLTSLGPQIRTWRSPSYGKPIPLHRLPGPGQKVQTIGVVGSWKVLQKRTTFAKMTLVGSHSTVECVIWQRALDHLIQSGLVPEVGQVAGVDAVVHQAREFIPRDDYDDGTGDESESAPRKELYVDNVWFGPIDDPSTIDLPDFRLPARPKKATPDSLAA